MTLQTFGSEKKLRRVLGLKDLIIYGIILIQPVAALPLFGHANTLSKGHAVTSVLIAMLAMIFTAWNYGKMAGRYPASGSAYKYVSKGIHPYAGFIAGWLMFMDYMFIPIFCVIFTSITAHHLIPYIPYSVWAFFFITGFTLININGVKMAARTNWILLIVMSVVVFYFMGAAIRYVVLKEGFTGLFSVKPFFNSNSFSFGDIGSATALAALTYIGFDGITTLSEEVKNPKRNVLIAAILTCVITGLWSGSQIYLAQLSWPDWGSFSRGITDQNTLNQSLDTAIMSVANRVGGPVLDASLSFILLLGSIGSGSAGQLGASRLLYGMGRDGVIPAKVFGHLDKKHSSPVYNILIISVISISGALFFSLEEAARLINFGAFFAFMGVNLASIREFYMKSEDKTLKKVLIHLLPSAFGFAFSFYIWLNLPMKTFLIGGSWMLAGLTYLAIKTKGFRKPMIVIDFSENV